MYKNNSILIPLQPPIITGIYIANMSQTSTNPPIPDILQNTLGKITWSYLDVGQYQGTLTNAFGTTKNYLKLDNSTGSAPGVHIDLFWVSQDVIQFEYTYNGSYQNGFDTNIMIEITKYRE